MTSTRLYVWVDKSGDHGIGYLPMVRTVYEQLVRGDRSDFHLWHVRDGRWRQAHVVVQYEPNGLEKSGWIRVRDEETWEELDRFQLGERS